jgi:hypothetical protein
MSGIKPQPLAEFYRLLHARGETTGTLATKLCISGGALRRVIGGHRRRGHLWRKLAPLLTAKEISLLKDVEQSSTWNARRQLAGSRWTKAKQAMLAANAA